MARPVSARAFTKLSKREQLSYERYLQTLRHMRSGDSLSAAAKRAGTTARTVKAHGGSDLSKRGARYKIFRDRAYRVVDVAVSGSRPIPLRVTRREASIVGSHWSTIGWFLTADSDRQRAAAIDKLERFGDVVVAEHDLETDPGAIETLAGLGLLDFDDIYQLAG